MRESTLLPIRKSAPSRRGRETARPRLEQLEDRCLLSARPFAFDAVAYLGDPAPGGATYGQYFVPTDINNHGDIIYGADLEGLGGEGVFLREDDGDIRTLARVGDPAPGGGTFGLGFNLGFTGMALNDTGDAAFNFLLGDELTLPVGTNFGVYRYSHARDRVTAVVVPNVTPAPGGGTFQGSVLGLDINTRGDLVFGGIIPTTEGISGDLGMGVFLQDRQGRIVSVVSPGDPAPGGSTFDFAENPTINNRGDVAFGAHVAGEEVIDFGVPQEERIFAAESVYLKRHTGQIVSIAHQGQAVPASAGGGTYRLAFGPVVNNRGQVLFVGDLTPAPSFGEDLGLFLWDNGRTIAIARPGDQMPGGGTLVNVSFFINTYDLNDRGAVSFSGSLDTDDDGVIDASGVFFWAEGRLSLVAQTGTVMQGIGTLVQIYPPDFVDFFGGEDGDPYTWYGAGLNDRGQVLFHAAVETAPDTLEGPIVVATPRGHGHGLAVAVDRARDALFALLDDLREDDWWFGGRGRGHHGG